MGICGNIAGGIFSPASGSLLPDIVNKDNLGKVMSLRGGLCVDGHYCYLKQICG